MIRTKEKKEVFPMNEERKKLFLKISKQAVNLQNEHIIRNGVHRGGRD